MNALQLVNEHLSRFSLKEVTAFGATGSDSAIALRKINLAIQEICSAHDFKWLHKTSVGTFTAATGTASYSLTATDVKQLIAVKHTYGNGGNIQIVDRAALEMYRPDRGDSSQRDIPTHLCLFGKTQSGTNWLWQVELWPPPSADFNGETVSYYYTILPTDLSATTDVPIVPNDFHWLILEKAEMLARRGPLRVGGDDRQIDFYSAAAQAYRDGIQKLIAEDSISGTSEGTWETGRVSI